MHSIAISEWFSNKSTFSHGLIQGLQKCHGASVSFYLLSVSLVFTFFELALVKKKISLEKAKHPWQPLISYSLDSAPHGNILDVVLAFKCPVVFHCIC